MFHVELVAYVTLHGSVITTHVQCQGEHATGARIYVTGSPFVAPAASIIYQGECLRLSTASNRAHVMRGLSENAKEENRRARHTTFTSLTIFSNVVILARYYSFPTPPVIV